MTADADPSEVTLELVRGVQAGRRRDLELLCERVAPTVYAFAHMRMKPGLRRQLDPSEVVQEVWLRVLTRIGTFETDRAGFRSWVIGIARNVLLEMSRKTLRQQEPPTGQDGERWESFFASQPDEATAVRIGIARREALREFLERAERIGEVERQILLLHGIEGRGLEEVAEESQAQ